MTSVALGIFRLEPAGGLERHALRLAAELAERGLDVTLYATGRTPTPPPGVRVIELPRRGFRNHQRMAAFAESFHQAAHGRHDLIVGFQKLTGLDVLFCADPCIRVRRLTFWSLLTGRYQMLRRLEAACFDAASRTRILALAPGQWETYRRVYGTPAERAVILPPTTAPHAPVPSPDPAARGAIRAGMGIDDESVVWLWAGLHAKVKGLDRALRALDANPNAHLVICGAEVPRGLLLAHGALLGGRHAGRVHALGHVSEPRLEELFAAADLLVHPARSDVTGTVILEAILRGLPVIATEACGYAPYITEAEAGQVIPDPFRQPTLDAALRAAGDSATRARWSASGAAYAKSHALDGGIACAAALIAAAAAGDEAAWARPC